MSWAQGIVPISERGREALESILAEATQIVESEMTPCTVCLPDLGSLCTTAAQGVFFPHCHMALWAQVLSYMEGKSSEMISFLPLTISGKNKLSELWFRHLLTWSGHNLPCYFVEFCENPKAF